MKTEKQIAAAAAEFAERWKGRGYERGESQPFWIDLLTNVFGIETPSDGFITFEEHHKVDASNYVDGPFRNQRKTFPSCTGTCPSNKRYPPTYVWSIKGVQIYIFFPYIVTSHSIRIVEAGSTREMKRSGI